MENDTENRAEPKGIGDILKQEKVKPKPLRPGPYPVPLGVGTGYGKTVKNMFKGLSGRYQDDDEIDDG